MKVRREFNVHFITLLNYTLRNYNSHFPAVPSPPILSGRHRSNLARMLLMTITCKNEITKDMKGSNESDTSSERLKIFLFLLVKKRKRTKQKRNCLRLSNPSLTDRGTNGNKKMRDWVNHKLCDVKMIHFGDFKWKIGMRQRRLKP